MDDDVVGFHRIGNRRHHAVRRCDILRKIVDHPVGEIFNVNFVGLAMTLGQGN